MSSFTYKILQCTLLLTLFFLFACKKDHLENGGNGESKVKYVNAVAVEHAQNISVDEGLVSTEALKFAENTDYLKVKSGSRSISFWADGDLDTFSSINFTASISYSAFLVLNKLNVREIASFEDNLSNTDMNMAKIRFINLTPAFNNGINVSVLDGTQFVNGLGFKNASNYFSVDPNLNLKYNVLGSSNVKTIPLNTLKAGKIYNIWFSGNTTADLEAHILLNN